MKKSMEKAILAIATIFLAVACDKDSSKPTAGSAIPDHVEKLSAPSTRLNEDQVAELSHFMKNFAKIPDGNLLWKEKDESLSEAKKREEKINELDEDGKNHLNQIAENCIIQDPIETHTPPNTPPSAGSTSRHQKISKISGPRCPVLYENSSESAITYSKFNYDKNKNSLEASGPMTATDLSKQEILSPEMSDRADLVRKVSKISSNGFFETSDYKIRWYQEADVNLTLTTKTGTTITITGRAHLLVRNLGFNEVSAESSSLFKIHMPRSEVVLSIFSIADRNGTTQSINLNGKDLSEAEMKNIFGNTFSLSMN